MSDLTIRRCLSQSGPHGRWSRKTPNHKKTRLEFVKMHIDKPQSFCENLLWTYETKLELFGKSHQLYVYRHMTHTKKKHWTYCETWRRLGYVQGLLCCIWHRVCWICAWYNEFSRIWKHFVAKYAVSESLVSGVMGPPTGKWPKTHSQEHPRMAKNLRMAQNIGLFWSGRLWALI